MGVEFTYISASLFFYSLALEMNSLHPSAEPLYFFLLPCLIQGSYSKLQSFLRTFQGPHLIFMDYLPGMYITVLYYVHVVVNFSFEVIFVFLLFCGMEMYANEVEAREK